MNKILTSTGFAVVMLLAACGSSSNSPDAIGKKWCELDKAVSQAQSEEEEEAASKKRDAYENEITEKYGEDEDFMDKVGEAVEACENEGY